MKKIMMVVFVAFLACALAAPVFAGGGNRNRQESGGGSGSGSMMQNQNRQQSQNQYRYQNQGQKRHQNQYLNQRTGDNSGDKAAVRIRSQQHINAADAAIDSPSGAATGN